MGQTAPDDPALQTFFREAMEIWLAELPSIPIVQWYHRIPHNQTYWKNWPSAENPLYKQRLLAQYLAFGVAWAGAGGGVGEQHHKGEAPCAIGDLGARNYR